MEKQDPSRGLVKSVKKKENKEQVTIIKSAMIV